MNYRVEKYRNPLVVEEESIYTCIVQSSLLNYFIYNILLSELLMYMGPSLVTYLNFKVSRHLPMAWGWGFTRQSVITDFPFISSNIPASLAYEVYISQLICYSKLCAQYSDFLHRAQLLTHMLLQQGYGAPRLKS